MKRDARREKKHGEFALWTIQMWELMEFADCWLTRYPLMIVVCGWADVSEFLD